MKVLTFTISLFLITGVCLAQNRSIKFETSTFADVKAKAKKENKLIFVDAFTTWCGPCKWMAANIFTNDTVADYYNSRFINAQIDMEKGEGPDFALLYDVRCYPNLLYIDGDGNVVHRSAGSGDTKGFIQLAEDAQNPEKQFSRYKNEYESKKFDPVFLVEYLNIISNTCLPFENIISDYFSTVKDEDLSSNENWNILRDYSSNYKSREIIYLLNNIETFSKKYTSDAVNSKIKNVFMGSGFKILRSPEMKEDDYTSYKSEISKFNLPGIDEVIFQLDLNYFYMQGNMKGLIDLAVEKGDLYFKNLSEFNQISWTIYEQSDDTVALQKAASWMQKALEDKENQQYFAYDTYAAVLFKLNKKAEAKAIALKAIEVAKDSGINEEEYQSTTELLQKIEKLN